MDNYWFGVMTVFIVVSSFGLSAWYEHKTSRPIIHWLLGLIAGIGALACFIAAMI